MLIYVEKRLKNVNKEKKNTIYLIHTYPRRTLKNIVIHSLCPFISPYPLHGT